MDYYGELEQLLHEAAKLLKATPDTVSEKIAHLQAENKELHSEVESLKSKLAKDAMGDVMDQAVSYTHLDVYKRQGKRITM